MRLLNTTTLKLKQFTGDTPPYAILSHTWGDQEVTLQEIELPERDQKKGFAKILGCCAQARKDGLEWAWIDACCIDKTSSAELSEAINSMFAWYHHAEVCYAYLEDVTFPSRYPHHAFRSARWFTRGWCLQELIAPYAVKFYSADWCEIGTKLSLCGTIYAITGIPKAVLFGTGNALENCNIAQKMSWASTRETTRVEDGAYSLLGIFGINMPMLYGEGTRAFQRLQEQIIQQSEDYSFLLWTGLRRSWRMAAPRRRRAMTFYDEPDNIRVSGCSDYGLGYLPPDVQFPVFASRPSDFDWRGPVDPRRGTLDFGALKRCGPLAMESTDYTTSIPALSWLWNPLQMTNRGLRVSLPSCALLEDQSKILMWTGLTYKGYLVCVPLLRDKTATGPGSYSRCGSADVWITLLNFEMAALFETRDIYLSTSNTHGAHNLASSHLGGIDLCLSASTDTLITPATSNLRFERKLVTQDLPGVTRYVGLRDPESTSSSTFQKPES